MGQRMGVPSKCYSSLPRTRLMVKGFKIEVGISLWDLQAGWDSVIYSGVEKASHIAGRRSAQNTQYSMGRSMPEWKVN